MKKEEIVELCKNIYRGNKIDIKYNKYIDNLKEQIKMREKYLKNINDVNLIENLVSDPEKFKDWLYKKYFYLSKDEFSKKIIDFDNLDIVQMAKDDDIVNKINVCFWFEELLKFSRLKINDIKYNDVENIKNIFLKNIDKFYIIYKNNNCKNKIIKSIKYKINCIINNNYLQKFIADCYNHIISNIINITFC